MMSYKDDITPGECHWSKEFCDKITAQASFVYAETGKTPRELQQERDEALAALQDFLDYHSLLSEYEGVRVSVEAMAKDIIAKIEGDKHDST